MSRAGHRTRKLFSPTLSIFKSSHPSPTAANMAGTGPVPNNYKSVFFERKNYIVNRFKFLREGLRRIPVACARRSPKASSKTI